MVRRDDVTDGCLHGYKAELTLAARGFKMYHRGVWTIDYKPNAQGNKVDDR